MISIYLSYKKIELFLSMGNPFFLGSEVTHIFKISYGSFSAGNAKKKYSNLKTAQIVSDIL